MPEYLEKELSPASEEDVKKEIEKESKETKKPYLKVSDLNGDPRKEVQILEWMDFLLSKTDINGLFDSLSYYVEMEWISKNAKNQLLTYARHFLPGRKESALSTVKIGEEEYKIGESHNTKGNSSKVITNRPKPANLSLKEHFQSLKYILQISNRVNEEIQKEAMKKAGITEET